MEKIFSADCDRVTGPDTGTGSVGAGLVTGTGAGIVKSQQIEVLIIRPSLYISTVFC